MKGLGRAWGGLLAAAALALAAACTTPETAPGTVKEAVSEAPCDPGKKPQKPVYAGDQLKGEEDIWTLVTTLWSDRKARRAYELALEIFAAECSKP